MKKKVVTVEGKEYTLNQLYIESVLKYGYDKNHSREGIRNKIRMRIAQNRKNHRKHELAKLIAR